MNKPIPEPDNSFNYICKKYRDWFLNLGIQIPPGTMWGEGVGSEGSDRFRLQRPAIRRELALVPLCGRMRYV